MRHLSSSLLLVIPVIASAQSADSLFLAGRLDAARVAYAASPASTLAVRRIALMDLWANRLDSAEARLNRLVANDSTDRELTLALAEVLYRRRHFPRAAELMRLAGRASVAAKLASLPSPYLVTLDAPTRIPFAAGAILPLISVRVNGVTGNFLLDTGAGETIVDSSFAAAVRARLFGVDSALYAGGRRGRYRHASVDSIQIGDARIHGVPVKVQPTRAYAPAAGGRTVDGILGTIILSEFQATLDFGAQALVLAPRASAAAIGHVIPFWLLGDHFITVPATANGVETLLVFDTGLALPGGALVPSAGLVRHAGVTPAGDAVSGVGGGGRVSVTPFTFPKLEVGTLTRTDVMAVAGAFPDVLEQSFGIRLGGLLSHGFYSTNAVTIDFARMTLTVREHADSSGVGNRRR